jgi:small subunit ribosomal protein S20
MPHSRSAKKQWRKSQKRRLHNRALKKTIKTQIKKVLDTSEKGTLEDLKKEFIVAVKKLDTAAAHRVVHPNLAARKKSQLARLLHKKETAGASST